MPQPLRLRRNSLLACLKQSGPPWQAVALFLPGWAGFLNPWPQEPISPARRRIRVYPMGAARACCFVELTTVRPRHRVCLRIAQRPLGMRGFPRDDRVSLRSMWQIAKDGRRHRGQKGQVSSLRDGLKHSVAGRCPGTGRHIRLAWTSSATTSAELGRRAQL